ncbi:probable ATP-dependent RNA helicase spindle-E [Chironomus tepperi]|uniref:probable ATP-dependent RNA helicase spindle-E n=1 Tax=Chironomus tepperi TaxID=113505 RepID=UPI00391F5B83
MSEDKEDIELPIMKYQKEIAEAVGNNPITIIYGGETGCGKSTKIPQFILDDEKGNCKIICTEPRKIAAITLAQRVSNERKCDLGRTVGYQVGLSKKSDTENHQTKLLFCTTGVLLEKILYGKGIDQFSHIILDEIHERDTEIDLLMMIIRDYILTGADTKLILMSATLNIKEFEDYFTLVVKNHHIKPAIVNIQSERKFNIEIGYLDDIEGFDISNKIINFSIPSITTEMYHLAAQIIEQHIQKSTKSILVFLPGIYEIESAHSILRNYESIQDKYLLIIMHSSLTTDNQKEAFMRSALPKVILSTNIAESSVTIPNVECVIDFCLTKNIVKENSSMSSLKMEYTSKNSLIQRAGRTGRTCDGVCYRLIHKRYFNMLLKENIPEMQRGPLENVILRVKQLEYEAPVPLLNKCMSPPNKVNVIKSVLKLKELGGLKIVDDDENFTSIDGDLIYIGKVMSNLPIDCQLTKLILFGYMFSVLDEIIIIAAGLNIKSVFQTHYNRKLEDYILKVRWSNGSGCDAITILNAYKFWQNEREKGTLRKYEDEQKWCNKYGLDRKNLHEMRLLIFKIQNRLKVMNIEPLTGSKAITWSEKEKPLIIKMCLTGAFMPNMFFQGKSDAINEREVYKTLCGLNPNKTVYFRRMDRDQIGEVYAEQIKDALVENKIAESKEGIKVSFDCTRVFVQFSDKFSMIDDDKYDENNIRSRALHPGTICNEVYTAVKYRKTGARNKMLESKKSFNDDNSYSASFEINVMPVNETREYACKYKILDYVNGKLQVKKYLCNMPEHVYCPSYNTKEMVGYITHVEHCNKFYFQPVDECNAGILADIEKGLEREELFSAKNLKVNKLVIALHDTFYKRAKIMKIYEDLEKADCYMFDYGYVKEIAFTDLYEANEEVMQYYFLIYERCFECRLSKIAPSSSKCMRGKWTLEAIEEFREKVIKAFVKVKIYSFVDEVAAVEVFVGKENINDHMIKTGYARMCEENYMSKLNHKERENVQWSKNWISREKEFQDKESNIIKISIPPPPIQRCKKVLRLEGPYSPLETTLTEVSIENRGIIQIDQTSVNSVLLDNEIENYEGTVVIAADIMQNPTRGITLYNVTTLPNIYGISTLVALMFAPNFVFYQNPERKQFVGVRFGLGCNENTSKAYYYDHDSYLNINYENTFQEDIADINHLRVSMSTLLKGEKITAILSEKDKEECMYDIKHLIIKILSKDRIPVHNPEFHPDKSDLWDTNCGKIDVYIRDLYRGGPFPSIMLPSLNKDY